jgi:hypothetical protein
MVAEQEKEENVPWFFTGIHLKILFFSADETYHTKVFIAIIGNENFAWTFIQIYKPSCRLICRLSQGDIQPNAVIKRVPLHSTTYGPILRLRPGPGIHSLSGTTYNRPASKRVQK